MAKLCHLPLALSFTAINLPNKNVVLASAGLRPIGMKHIKQFKHRPMRLLSTAFSIQLGKTTSKG
jgi:hypothetical protein